MGNNTNDYTNETLATIITAAYIVLLTVFLVFSFVYCKRKLDSNRPHFIVAWSKPDSLNIKPGPSWFLYDFRVDSLISIKRINDFEKMQLLGLVDANNDEYSSYAQAINTLVYISNTEPNKGYFWALLLTAVCGILGVQLRTINNFIGVTCFSKDFDLSLWWPWYFVRPFIGGLIGPILYILIEGNLYNPAKESGSSEVVIISLALLAGFGSDHFLESLRKLSKRIFGSEESKSKKEMEKIKEEENQKEKKNEKGKE